jgi:hypothetical protein
MGQRLAPSRIMEALILSGTMALSGMLALVGTRAVLGLVFFAIMRGAAR